MKRDDWKPSKYSVLCEKHFKLDDYAMPGIQSMEYADQTKKYLKPDAVPSVFNFPPHLVQVAKHRNPPAKRKAPIPEEQTNPKKKRPNQPDVQDHGYSMPTEKVIAKLKKSLQQKRKKIRALRSKNLRKEKTIKGLVKKLEDMQHLSKDQSQSLLSNFGHMTRDIFINEQKNTNKSKSSRYADTIKQFAVSLHFYSPRAYKFVRRSLHLPCPSTI